MAPRKVDTRELAKLLRAQEQNIVQLTVVDALAIPSLRKKLTAQASPDELLEIASDVFSSLLPLLVAQANGPQKSFRLKKSHERKFEGLSLYEFQRIELILLEHLQAVVRKHLSRQPIKLGQYSSLITSNIHNLLLQSSLLDEKKRKKTMTRSANKYARLLDLASDAVFLVDFQSGLFVEANKAACGLTGYSEAELKQAGLNSLVSVFDLNVALEQTNTAIEQGAVRFDNLSIYTKKGKSVPVDISATAVMVDGKKHVLAIVRDIKERKKFEEEIQQKAKRLQVLNEIARAISSAELETEAVLTSILRSIARVIKVEAGSILKLEEGQLIFLAALGEKAEFVKPFHLKLGQGIAGWVAENGKGALVRDAHKDPRYYAEVERAIGFVSHTLLAVPMKIGEEVVGVIELINKKGGVFNRKDLELMEAISGFAAVSLRHAGLFNECKAARSQLSQMQSAVSSSKLAAVVAHEMKDPLGIVKNYLKILDGKLASADVKPEELTVVSEEVDRITSIADQLLRFSEAYTEEPKETPLNLLIGDSITSVRDKLENAGIRTELKLEETLPEVFVIPNQMNMVFSNLIKLAIMEMPMGGTLTITTRQVDSSLCIEFSNTRARHSSAEAYELFLPSAVARGLVPKGLGLYMVFNIIQGYGGDIKVGAGEDGGNVFSVFLPIKSSWQAGEAQP
jgi:PAS domain S-box-containing protein